MTTNTPRPMSAVDKARCLEILLDLPEGAIDETAIDETATVLTVEEEKHMLHKQVIRELKRLGAEERVAKLLGIRLPEPREDSLDERVWSALKG